MQSERGSAWKADKTLTMTLDSQGANHLALTSAPENVQLRFIVSFAGDPTARKSTAASPPLIIR